MKQIVGVAEMRVSKNRDEEIITYALGSCLGIVVYDPKVCVGGMLHVMLPLSTIDPIKAEKNPYMFVDTGVPRLFRDCYSLGAQRNRVIVKIAGGATFRDDKTDFFAIGKRNFIIVRKLLWKNSFMISSEDVGGNISRTLSLNIKTGRTIIKSGGKEWEL